MQESVQDALKAYLIFRFYRFFKSAPAISQSNLYKRQYYNEILDKTACCPPPCPFKL